MRIAKDPRGKKCGPKLFPIIFEKINPDKLETPTPATTPTCLIDSKPKKVMGQLFMKLAPTVTIKLGARTESTDGREAALKKAVAKKSIAPL